TDVFDSAALLALCKDALSRAGEPEAEIFARYRRRGVVRVGMGAVREHMDLVEPLIVARVARGRRVPDMTTSRLECSEIVDAIQAAGRAAAFVPETEHFPGFSKTDEALLPSPPRYAASTATLHADDRTERLAPVLQSVENAGLVSAGILETGVS